MLTEIQLCVELGVRPSIRTVLLNRPDGCNAKASRHCGASGGLQRPIRMVSQEPVDLT
jgi:hypothetical protein